MIYSNISTVKKYGIQLVNKFSKLNNHGNKNENCSTN